MHSKKFFTMILFLLAITILAVYAYCQMAGWVTNGLESEHNLSRSTIESLSHMTNIEFLNFYKTDFIYKQMIPFFAIFLSLLSVESFGTDYYGGTMKFFVYISNNKINIFLQKIYFVMLLSLALVVLNFTIGFILGGVFFKFDLNGAIEMFFIYLASVLPTAAIAVSFGLISMIFPNQMLSMGIAIIGPILLCVSDKLLGTSKYSSIGIIEYINSVELNEISSWKLLIYNGMSLSYLIILIIGVSKCFKKFQYRY